MKRFFLFALVFLTALLPSISTVKHTVSAAEESGFAVAETADVWFYAEENEESKLFCLPRTYYVKILTKGGEFCAVEYLRDNPPYKKIRGYCKTNAPRTADSKQSRFCARSPAVSPASTSPEPAFAIAQLPEQFRHARFLSVYVTVSASLRMQVMPAFLSPRKRFSAFNRSALISFTDIPVSRDISFICGVRIY